MTTREKWISYREDKQIIESMDKLADQRGIDRSGFIRQTIHEKLKAETDSIRATYSNCK